MSSPKKSTSTASSPAVSSSGTSTGSASATSGAVAPVTMLPPGGDMLRLGPAICTFDVPVEWDDMDVTHDCYMLLACYQGGLKACDLTGKVLSTWRPPKLSGGKQDSVVTVDCLDDGRVAAGLHSSGSVAILSYMAGWSDSWHEERRIPLKSRPYRVSAYGDLLAVAGERPDGGGDHVIVMQLGEGSHGRGSAETVQSLSLSCLCDIALTSNCLFALREKADEAGDRLVWVVEAYDRQGNRLWQQASATRIECIVAVPRANVLYISVPGAKKVLEVSCDGRLLGNIVRCADMKPGAIALSKGEQKMFAIASSNGRTFTVYPVVI